MSLVKNRYESQKGLVQLIIEYMFAFLTVLQCDSVFFDELNHNRSIINLSWQFFLILLFIHAISSIYKLHQNSNRLSIFLLIFTMVMIIFLSINFIQYHFGFFYFVLFLLDPDMLLVVFYFYLTKKDSANLLFKIEKIIIIFAIISLFFWLVGQLGLQPNVTVNTHWHFTGSVPGYFYLYFLSTGYRHILGIDTIRNSGIFVEAPLYSYMLSIALFIELFLREHISRSRIIYLFITILTTFSTTGIVMSSLAIFYYLLINGKFHKYKILLLLLLPILIFILYRIISLKFNSDEVQKEQAGLSSASMRMDDFNAGIKAFKLHPIIGTGINNGQSIINQMDPNRLMGTIPATGLSLGFTTALAFGGIILGLYYIIPTILSMKVSAKLFGLAIFSFLLFTLVIVNNAYIYIMILSYLWMLIVAYKSNINIRNKDMS